MNEENVIDNIQFDEIVTPVHYENINQFSKHSEVNYSPDDIAVVQEAHQSIEEHEQPIQDITDVTNDIIVEQKRLEEQQTLINYLKNRADNEKDGQSANALAVTYYLANNLDGAVEYFEKACEQDNATAQRNFAILLETESDNIDFNRVFNLYSAAAEFEDIIALNNLGCCYLNGEGTEQNMHKAIECFKKAAELGDSIAQVNLGDCYSLGNGVKQNLKKAYELYAAAAEQGDVDGLKRVAECYINGQGVKQDMHKAIECFVKAAELGDSEAEKMVDKLQEKLAVRKHDKSVLEERLEAASEKLANEKNQKNSVEPTKEQQKTDRSEI